RSVVLLSRSVACSDLQSITPSHFVRSEKPPVDAPLTVCRFTTPCCFGHASHSILRAMVSALGQSVRSRGVIYASSRRIRTKRCRLWSELRLGCSVARWLPVSMAQECFCKTRPPKLLGLRYSGDREYHPRTAIPWSFSL